VIRSAAFLGLLVLLACASPRKPEPVIAASIPPLASMAEYLVKGRFPVVSMLPPGRSPHDYEPTPAEVDRARGAVLVVYVHPQIDGWMVRAARGVTGERAPLVGMEQTPLAAGRDPHLWLDLDVVREFVPRLAGELAAVDSAGADLYLARSRAFLDTLRAIDEDAARILSPVAGVPFAINHAAFDSFVRRYGLNLVAVLEKNPEGEALPQSLGDTALRLKQQGARVLFAEPQLSPRTANALAVDLHAKVALLDPQGGPYSPGRETYFDLLRWNVRQLAENLR
jgi:zinc transport system substrate-binding protein